MADGARCLAPEVSQSSTAERRGEARARSSGSILAAGFAIVRTPVAFQAPGTAVDAPFRDKARQADRLPLGEGQNLMGTGQAHPETDEGRWPVEGEDVGHDASPSMRSKSSSARRQGPAQHSGHRRRTKSQVGGHGSGQRNLSPAGRRYDVRRHRPVVAVPDSVCALPGTGSIGPRHRGLYGGICASLKAPRIRRSSVRERSATDGARLRSRPAGGWCRSLRSGCVSTHPYVPGPGTQRRRSARRHACVAAGPTPSARRPTTALSTPCGERRQESVGFHSCDAM